MAYYQESKYLSQAKIGVFDEKHSPGALTALSGIYKCMGCGHEIASIAGKPLPPQDHHTHPAGAGAITWRLVVFAEHASTVI